ncbi:hypothetical protein EVJ58_g1568 [Rhodofomes roseus]|uniref:NAD(P)-binding protein n=1 Tax=Rhodofomes roseus TaxID=34475 RepID=A0A4Y9YY71_9APHY|nr:hypothetical protein EVJ58_g1568 [Rhodofomes roseus]
MMGLFSKSFDPETDLPDLSGNVIIVTGGNSGVGCAAIQYLARRGAKVYMAARNEEKAKAAIEKRPEGREEGSGGVHGEGAALGHRWLLTPFSIQEIAVVNYFSPYVFIRTLLPLLKRTAQEPDSDQLKLTSEGHRLPPNNCHFRTIEDFNREFKGELLASNKRYNFTKYMGVLHVKELQKRLNAEGAPIIVTAVHPGIVNTDGVQNFANSSGTFKAPLYSFIANAFFTSPEKGAYSTVFAAAAPEIREDPMYKGGYIVPPGKLGSVYPPTEDPELGKELWETTEKILADIGV